MKKLIVLLTFSRWWRSSDVGRFNLGEAGAMRFLAKMESLMSEGKSDEVCAMFHDDLEVEIADHSGESTQTCDGGKEEFCELTQDDGRGPAVAAAFHERGVHRRQRRSRLAQQSVDRRRELFRSTARFTIPGANVIAAHRQRR